MERTFRATRARARQTGLPLRELLVRYDGHPWFREAPVSQLFNVELLHGQHLHWPDCDVDLHVDSLEHPERFPLVSRKPSRPSQKARPRRPPRTT